MIVGGLSGYFGGWIDLVSMRVVEVVLSVPDLYLLIVLGGMLRGYTIDGKPLTSRQTYMVLVFIMSFVGWAGRARVVRGMVLSLRENDYVVAARALGVSSWRAITRHILPNTLTPVLVAATLSLGLAILSEATLSFLGVGMPVTQPSLGTLIRIGNQYLFSGSWWVVVFPSIQLGLIVLAVNLLGDWLRDALNPKLR